MNELLEALIKALGSNPTIANKLGTDEMVQPDEPYLKQYLNPSKDALRPQPLRPTSLTMPSAMPWRQTTLPDSFRAALYRGEKGGKVPEERDLQHNGQQPLTADELNRLRAGQILEGVYPVSVGSGASEGLVGLGNFTSSVGRDAQGPYYSAYDKWDFSSPVVAPLVGQIMKRVGAPYHVYDQFGITADADGAMTLRRRALMDALRK